MITLDHDKYEPELNNMPESHNKSIQARDNMKLQPVKTEDHPSDLKARLPKLYRALGEDPGIARVHWLAAVQHIALSALHALTSNIIVRLDLG